MLESELVAIAANPDERAAYLDYAAHLDDRGDPRGRLVRVHVALEDAQGVEAEALRAEERAIFATHGDVLLGPFAPVAVEQAKPHSFDSFVWFRGFLTAIRHLPVPRLVPWQTGDEEPFETPFSTMTRGRRPPGEALAVALGERVAGADPVRARGAAARAVRRHAAAPRRAAATLEVGWLVASAPLVHAGLETLRLQGDDVTAAALASAELPSLKRLVLTDLPLDPAVLGRLAVAVAALASRPDVELVFPWRSHVRRPAALLVGREAVAALAPMAERIVRLGVPCDGFGKPTELSWDLALPRLRRLDTSGCPAPSSWSAPAWRMVDELSISPAPHGDHPEAVATALVDGEICERLRVLRIALELEVAPRAFTVLSRGAFRELEHLVLVGSYSRGPWFEGVAEDAFPALRRLEAIGPDVTQLRAMALGARVAISPIVGRPWEYGAQHRGGADVQPVVRPQMHGDAGAAPDLRNFARYAAIWREGRRFLRACDVALTTRAKRPPAALAACARFLKALGVDLDYARFVGLDAAGRRARVAAWYETVEAALRDRDGAVAAPLFQLGALAQGALRDHADAQRFVRMSEALLEPARSELEEVRGWCGYLASGQPWMPDAIHVRYPHELELRVLEAPFAEGADDGALSAHAEAR